MSSKDKIAVFDSLVFSLGWFAAVFGAADGQLFLGPCVVLACYLNQIFQRHLNWFDWTWLILLALFGIFVDSILHKMGIFHLLGSDAGGFFVPAWFMALWFNFTLFVALAINWFRKNILMSILLGAAGGPLSYYGAAGYGVVTLGKMTLFVIAIEYMLIFLIGIALYDEIEKRFRKK